MKHTLKLTTVGDTHAHFNGRHELVPFVPGRASGEPPHGPFSIGMGTSLFREDWEAIGHPLEIEVDL